jgi:hypothetical protein
VPQIAHYDCRRVIASRVRHEPCETLYPEIHVSFTRFASRKFGVRLLKAPAWTLTLASCLSISADPDIAYALQN